MEPAHITGRAIGQGMGKMMALGFGAEIIYSFIIIACSLMIYFSTKELYDLTKHRGIKYFRLSFLFFAIAYFFRSFIKFALLYFENIEIRLMMPLFGSLTLLLFVYFSVMAIFYLLYSVIYKKWKNNFAIYLFNLIALLFALVLVFSGFSLYIYLLLNLGLLAIIGFALYEANRSKEKKKHFDLYVIYLLLAIFWMFNILDIFIPSFFQTIQLFIYLISSGIFLTILYKVLRKSG